MRQDRVFRREEFRFDEEIAERRMGRVGLRRVEDHFGVAGQFDFARARRIVGQRNAAHFGVVFGRNDNFHVRRDAGIGAPEIGLVFGKRNFIRLRPLVNRLITGRPNRAAAHVAQINEACPSCRA